MPPFVQTIPVLTEDSLSAFPLPEFIAVLYVMPEDQKRKIAPFLPPPLKRNKLDIAPAFCAGRRLPRGHPVSMRLLPLRNEPQDLSRKTVGMEKTLRNWRRYWAARTGIYAGFLRQNIMFLQSNICRLADCSWQKTF